MKLTKLLLMLLLGLNTMMAMATSNSMDNDWDIYCDEDECTPHTSQTKKQVKRLVDFSSYSYRKLQREIKLRHPKLGVAIGPAMLHQGIAQDIPVLGCIGDSLTISNSGVTTGIVGLILYLDSHEFESDDFALKYAISTYYLSPASVSGDVIQEQLVSNLKYNYSITNVASYFGVRLIHLLGGKRCNLTFDAGIGLNQVSTNFFIETPKIAYAIPDNAFRGTITNQFSYMGGAGFQIQNVFGKSPLGCGYTFMYLGEGQLNSSNPRIPATLKTGNNYANTIMCSLQIG